MSKTALIDLGTNSVRLVVVEVETGGGYTVVFQDKQPVSLGESSFLDRGLTPAAMDRTVSALEAMARTARALAVDEIRAVATSATRDAENRDYFLDLVREKTGLRLKVVSGLEEARLIYSGVAMNLNLGETPGLLVDIGGGSVELVIGDQRGFREIDSLPLGAARLAERFNLAAGDGRVDRGTYKTLVDYAASHSRLFTEKARGYDLAFCYGSSGTIENLVKINAFRHHAPAAGGRKYPPLPVSSLAELADWLGAMTTQERKKVPGLEARKVDLVLAGGAVLEALLKPMGLSAVSHVDYGLKHGLIFDLVGDRAGLDPGGLREKSVRRLGRRCRYDESHAETVAALALKLYDAFTAGSLLAARPRERELLRLAALLHDIGKFISYQGHHQHSYYLIKNSTLLGFDEDEVELLAFLALSHRKKVKWPVPGDGSEAGSGPEGRHQRQLGFLLRLADKLASSRRPEVLEALDLRFEQGKAGFLFQAGPGLEFDFEIEALNKSAKAFQNLFERPLEAGLKPREGGFD